MAMRPVKIVEERGTRRATIKLGRALPDDQKPRIIEVVGVGSPRAYVWMGGQIDGRERFFGVCSIRDLERLVSTHYVELAAARRRRATR